MFRIVSSNRLDLVVQSLNWNHDDICSSFDKFTFCYFLIMFALAGIRQSWVMSTTCVFRTDKMLITRPNTIIQIYCIIPLLYTATCFGCPDRPSSGRIRIHKNIHKGKEASPYSTMNCNCVFPRNRLIRLQLIHIVLQNSLGINHCETAT